MGTVLVERGGQGVDNVQMYAIIIIVVVVIIIVVVVVVVVIIIIIYPLTARVVEAPQMISQQVFSIFPCSPLPSGTLRTPGLSIP